METEYQKTLIEKLKMENEVKESVKVASKTRINLPEISLYRFSGNLSDWQTFWDFFSVTIHENDDISAIDKFKYLLSCLDGVAKDCLTGFSVTGAQYLEAVEHLRERYENKEHIIHQHYHSLSKIPKSRSNVNELRRTFDYIETKIRALHSMGENVETKHLIALIKSKLPEDVNIKLEESKDGEWTVTSLRKAINRFISAREISYDYCSVDSPTYFDFIVSIYLFLRSLHHHNNNKNSPNRYI